ncbi:MAG: ATP-binding protein [Saprospiraceae bacterium]|nr:ATP-binding protein [Saprospiraceae bacterium]
MLKIAFTGPESTGKTTLAAQMAEEFSTIWVPEYAREYLTELNGPYTQNDILEIADMQWETMEFVSRSSLPYIFFDTDMLVIKVWNIYKYGNCPAEIEERWRHQEMDLYFLCGTDNAWEDDPLREHPEERDQLFSLYKKELLSSERPFVELWGSIPERLEEAMGMVMQMRR